MFYSFFLLLRRLLSWIDFLLVTLIVYLLSFLPKFLTENWYYPVFRFWCKTFIRALGVNLKRHQKNVFPLPQQYIVIGNHPSAFEDIGMPYFFKAHFLAKEELGNWWILGRISRFARTFYVKRESNNSRKQALEELLNILEKGHNIGLYPEAGCKGRRIFLPFRYGTFEAAMVTGIPILPVFLHYESQEDFEWREKETLIHKLWKILTSENKTANYYVFDPICPKGFDSKEQLCQHIQNLYLQWQAKYLE